MEVYCDWCSKLNSANDCINNPDDCGGWLCNVCVRKDARTKKLNAAAPNLFQALKCVQSWLDQQDNEIFYGITSETAGEMPVTLDEIVGDALKGLDDE